MIRVQEEDFDQSVLFQSVRITAGKSAGAICTFTGLVREFDEINSKQDIAKNKQKQSSLSALYLEHYPGMTERALTAIANDAKQRFDLAAITIIHRIGKLLLGEQIVYVATASSHRKSAYDGCQYIMDYLKNDAPFWKKEFREDGSEKWIDQKQSDQDATKNWQQ